MNRSPFVKSSAVRPARRRVVRALGFVFIAAALAGCASTGYHSSQLDGHRYYRAKLDTHPLRILRVDGKDAVFDPAPVEPGLRKVTVQGPPAPANTQGVERSIDLQIAPCTRYHLVALRPNRLAADYSVQVDFQEPVPGCTPAPN